MRTELKLSVHQDPPRTDIWTNCCLPVMSCAAVGPLCFIKSEVSAASTRRFWSTSCFHLLPSFMDLQISFFFFFFLHNLAPVQRFKTTTGCFTDCDFTVLDWSVSSPDLPESCYQSNPGFSNTSAVPQAAHLHDTPHLDSSLWWRSPNWVVSVWKRTFLYCKDFLNSNNINIPVRVWDTELKNWFCWDISHHHWKLKPKMHEIFHFMHNEL